MDKPTILAEIRRTAASNGGVALGRERFLHETGIGEGDWKGTYWARWSDAVIEAGLQPNRFNPKLDERPILAKLAALVTRLGRFPKHAEMKLERRTNATFPSVGAIAKLGDKRCLMEKVMKHCASSPDLEGTLQLIEGEMPTELASGSSHGEVPPEVERLDGFVYLIKSGRFFKLGRTNSLGRRHREIAIQMPEACDTVHAIRTDDSVGIEAYWHKRLDMYRRNGEWFDLPPSEVRAFKRRKFM